MKIHHEIFALLFEVLVVLLLLLFVFSGPVFSVFSIPLANIIKIVICSTFSLVAIFGTLLSYKFSSIKNHIFKDTKVKILKYLSTLSITQAFFIILSMASVSGLFVNIISSMFVFLVLMFPIDCFKDYKYFLQSQKARA